MADIVLMMKVKSKPGQRDAMRAVWERHLKPHAADSAVLPTYFYSYSREPDEILIFEHYTDEAQLEANAQSAVVAAFIDEAEPLMDGLPDLSMGDAVWIKK